ncbi:UDP-glucose 4-epimerase GalE [Telmatospirillum siberiense]|uniref:UDP-glucose 4-epimerase n=1 Tax=Telmatospirillum siberiense TaxID=382514 RepID=A0A2N3PSD4_9PROT|nr:UDP-glucose 4-epimerase GalE [Telmatospirillum siberiense]PKU23286.1 UDP-glucose 4-epimerase GalE [Telmatospirillum siberiense]
MLGSEEPRSVLVTGGAGYIGAHVCRALASSGYRPISYDNLSHGHAWAVRWGPLETGDLLDGARLEAVMRQYRPQAVIHLAGLIAAGESVVDPVIYYRNNLTATLVLLETMRTCAIHRIVFSSSAGVYGEPDQIPIPEMHPQRPVNPYGASKGMVERILTDFGGAYGLKSLSLRYFNAVGASPDGDIGESHPKETHLVPLVLDVAAGLRPHIEIYGGDFPTNDGTCIRDYVHVCDLADAHILALKHLEREIRARAFNLGNEKGASVREVIDTAIKVTGRQISSRMRSRRPGDPAMLVADASLAKEVLGWRPAYSSLEQQIATAWDWHERYRSSDVRQTGRRSS